MRHFQTSLSGSELAEVKNGWAIWASKGHALLGGRLVIYLQINELFVA